mmetsp:Transcript_39370/g.63910  ORF Transcript_39370/g.63910 Transcript_39370/m.63910 type:complete len:93 (-) Transcript_39370:341-619(-)
MECLSHAMYVSLKSGSETQLFIVTSRDLVTLKHHIFPGPVVHSWPVGSSGQGTRAMQHALRAFYRNRTEVIINQLATRDRNAAKLAVLTFTS